MKSQEILNEIKSEIIAWLVKYGQEAFEFSVTASPSTAVNISKINAKIIIWHEANSAIAVEIYKKITDEFKLKYDENLRGQYLYIALKVGY